MATQQISLEEKLENQPITHEKQPAVVESPRETMTPEERQIFDRIGQMHEVIGHFQTNAEGIPFGPNDYKIPGEVRELKQQLQEKSGRSYDEWKERLQGAAVAPEEPKQQEVPQQQHAAKISTTAVTEQEIRNAIRSAEVQHIDVKDLMRRPGVVSKKEAEGLIRRGHLRAALIGILGRDPARERELGIESAYQKLVDRKADKLIAERSEMIKRLGGVNANGPVHLLPSKQYRAAERLTQIDQELRQLRPLSNTQYRRSLTEAGAIAPVAEKATNPAVETQNSVRQTQPAPAVTRELTPREKALEAIRTLQSETPVDGFRQPAGERMKEKLIAQLNRNEPINLTARYATTNPEDAEKTHAKAIATNQTLIDAVRRAGVSVNTGQALPSEAQKKSERIDIAQEQAMKVAE
jgi:hypothetical protein